MPPLFSRHLWSYGVALAATVGFKGVRLRWAWYMYAIGKSFGRRVWTVKSQVQRYAVGLGLALQAQSTRRGRVSRGSREHGASAAIEQYPRENARGLRPRRQNFAKAALRAAGKATICVRRSPRRPRSSPTVPKVSQVSMYLRGYWCAVPDCFEQAQLELCARTRAALILW